jgi:hypothetical protein
MKTKEFSSLAKQLLPHVSGMIIHGPMMLAVPVGEVLRGIYFEGSDFDAKSFYVWVFWLPLYVPTERIAFNLGKRIRGRSGERWNAESAQLLENLATAIRCEALPFLGGLETPQGVVKAARLAAAESRDPYVHQALSYALAKAGETEDAVGAIDTLLGLLTPGIPWQAELGTRANLLKEKLLERIENAGAMLEGWRAESVRKLGLESIS